MKCLLLENTYTHRHTQRESESENENEKWRKEGKKNNGIAEQLDDRRNESESKEEGRVNEMGDNNKNKTE